MKSDLRERGIDESEWMELAMESRQVWRAMYRLETREEPHNPTRGEQVTNQVLCRACRRAFRRESDRKIHKCISERQKPIQEQRGAVHCTLCDRWFRSQGCYTVHTCRPQPAA